MRRIGITLALSVGALAMMVAVAVAGVVQVVALDECDPATFNAAFGPDTCVNVSVGLPGQRVNLTDFGAALPTGHPAWLFVSFPLSPNPPTPPDVPKVSIKKQDILIATNQGGIIHTFTEVEEFGNGFIPLLNNPTNATNTIPECASGFSNPAVASTRVIQGSSLEVSGRELEKGTHHFECCLHPWMRIDVIVK